MCIFYQFVDEFVKDYAHVQTTVSALFTVVALGPVTC